MPIALAIAGLIFIVTISYRETIRAYPNGGGAYIVAKENLGTKAGLMAGAALMIDYILTVAVSVAAGVENIASAFPVLQTHKVALSAGIVIAIMFINLRGIQESSSIFAAPTYIFIGSILMLLLVGTFRVITGQVVQPAPIIHETYPMLSLFLILRAFSSGCAALTGIEAISNGVTVFRHPAVKNAQVTMAWMALILGSFFLGITLLTHVYGVTPHEGETVVSQLSRLIYGNSILYYLVPAATAMILILAANTSYTGFPRLCSLIAKDRYLPRQLASLGDRLVFSNGILFLSLSSIALLYIFEARTHTLIPLYAIGVFLSFTLSQAGMVRYHLREREPGWFKGLAFNLLGAITTLVVLLVIAYSKFSSGAYLVIILIPLIIMWFTRIHNHYAIVNRELTLSKDYQIDLAPIKHTVIIPISGIHRGVMDALRYAVSISNDIRACYVELDSEATERIRDEWTKLAPDIPFVVLKSPYRSIIGPLLKYIDDTDQISHTYMLTVVIPEFITAKWWHQILHNQTALMIKTALMLRRGKVVTSVRYHLKET